MRLYKIENKKNGKIFIGIGEQGMFLDKCFAKYRDNPDLCPPITNEINEFGEDVFETSIIEYQKDNDIIYLIERQLEEIEKLGNKAYNQDTPPLAKIYDVN